MIPGAIFTVELHAPTAITSKIRRIEDPKEDPMVSNERFMRRGRARGEKRHE
jgi:hypothetical protein